MNSLMSASVGEQIDSALESIGGTPRRTFVIYPVLVLLFEALARRRWPVARPMFLPLMVWGYLQYRLVGEYRQHEHAGGRGFSSMPERILSEGPYAYTRNP